MATANPVDRHAGGRHGRCSADLGSFRLSGIGAHERSASSDGRVQDALSGRPKVAIVTGGSSGIGLEMVKKLIEKGYRVVANSRNITSAMALHGTADLKLVYGDIGIARVTPLQLAQTLHACARGWKYADRVRGPNAARRAFI